MIIETAYLYAACAKRTDCILEVMTSSVVTMNTVAHTLQTSSHKLGIASRGSEDSTY